MVIPKFKIINHELKRNYIVEKEQYLSSTSIIDNLVGSDTATWLESTYLKDKNGEELFDGDIVLMKWAVYDEPEPYVIFKSYTGEWRVDNGHSGKTLGFCVKDVEKIGEVFSGDYEKLLQEWKDRQEQMERHFR